MDERRRNEEREMRRLIYGLVVSLTLCGVTVAAAPPRSSAPAPATIVLNVPTTQVAAFTATGDATIYPSIGDSVTFTVTFSKTVEKYGPRIQVMCYQNGTLVYGEAGPYYHAFLLGGASSDWLNRKPGTRDVRGRSLLLELPGWSEVQLAGERGVRRRRRRVTFVSFPNHVRSGDPLLTSVRSPGKRDTVPSDGTDAPGASARHGRRCGCRALGPNGRAVARAPDGKRIDFARDVQPLLRANCYGCHNASLASGNFRLDRRRDSMPNRVGANGARIVPGNSE
jgi:hypothetical protein